MSWTNKQRISVVALVVLVATLPLVWQIGDVRRSQTIEQQQAELVDSTVQTTEQQRTEPTEGTGTTTEQPSDYDGDGIPDSNDRCPTRPEVENGFQDSDGCPDIVETTQAS